MNSRGLQKIPFWQRLRYRLILLIVLITLIPTLIITTFTLNRISTSAQQQIINQLESVVELKQSQINRYLNEAILTLDSIQNQPGRARQFTDFIETESTVTRRIFINIFQSSVTTDDETLIPIFDEVFLYNPEGKILASSNENNIDTNIQSQPYYEVSLNTTRDLEAPYIDAQTNELSFVITQQILEDGAVVGVIAGRLNISILQNLMLDRTGLGDTGETFLVARESDFLLTPGRFDDLNQPDGTISFDVDTVIDLEAGAGEYINYRSVDVLGAYRQIPVLDAVLLAEVEQQEALNATTFLIRSYIVIVLVTIIVTLLIAIFLATSVTLPITRLTHSVQELATGNYQSRVEINPQGEIGQLAQAYNSMAGELSDLLGSLENRVKSRTRDLQTVSRVSADIAQILDEEQLLNDLVVTTQEQLDLYHVAIFRFDEDAGHLVLSYASNQAVLKTEFKFKLDDAGIIPACASTRKPVIENDVTGSSIFAANTLLKETASEMAIPLIAAGRFLGVLDLQSKVTDRFQEQDIDVFQTLADQTAIALQNAILFGNAETARQQAEQSDKVKSAFLASMSHELRTPLNAIINFSQFVAGGDLGPVNNEQETMLNDVVNSARHLLGLINDVLDMSKIEAGSLNLFVVDNLDLQPVIQHVTSTARVLLQDKPVEIIKDFETDLPAIRGDKQRITQILLNVMSNACKFTDTGKIVFKAHRHGDSILMSIQDTGAGIASNDMDAVFEPFKQTTSGLRQGSGTGLGMPICKNLVEIHGGRLWIESELKVGTTVFVALPIKSEKLTPTLQG